MALSILLSHEVHKLAYLQRNASNCVTCAYMHTNGIAEFKKEIYLLLHTLISSYFEENWTCKTRMQWVISFI